MLVLLALASRTFGEEWLGAATFLANEAPDQYPLPAFPFYFFFAAMLTDSAILIAIMSISFVLAFFAALPPTFLIATRSLFAWSFDRILPDKVSEVNDRTHSPVCGQHHRAGRSRSSSWRSSSGGRASSSSCCSPPARPRS